MTPKLKRAIASVFNAEIERREHQGERTTTETLTDLAVAEAAKAALEFEA